MPTNRVPIKRTSTPSISPEAVELFAEMKALRCTCAPIDWKGRYAERERCSGCDTWWRLHARLADLLPGIRPWHWPVVQSPHVQNPYPEGSAAAKQWEPNRVAQERWRALDAAALAEADRS
jgi:hypothetical protein